MRLTFTEHHCVTGTYLGGWCLHTNMMQLACKAGLTSYQLQKQGLPHPAYRPYRLLQTSRRTSRIILPAYQSSMQHQHSAMFSDVEAPQGAAAQSLPEHCMHATTNKWWIIHLVNHSLMNLYVGVPDASFVDIGPSPYYRKDIFMSSR